jgi:hypothetical protein
MDFRTIKICSGDNHASNKTAARSMQHKRHILVEMMGLIMAVVVRSAGIQDRDGAELVFGKVNCDDQHQCARYRSLVSCPFPI